MSKVKRIKGAVKRRGRNRAVKSSIKSAIGELNQAISKKDVSSAGEILKKTSRLLDKAASKGAIHSNVAARRKSSLTRKVSSLSRTEVKKDIPTLLPTESDNQ